MKFTINASLIISISLVFLIFTPFSFANALESKTGITHSSKVWIPEEEFLSYFDANGIYTVVGNVKNENNFAVIPTISVSIKDDDIMYSNTIQHVPLAAGKEIDEIVFVRGIDFLIKEKIIIVSGTSDEIQNRELIIPEWFRNNALWWSQDNINNETFAKGLEYLINHGIVQV